MPKLTFKAALSMHCIMMVMRCLFLMMIPMLIATHGALAASCPILTGTYDFDPALNTNSSVSIAQSGCERVDYAQTYPDADGNSKTDRYSLVVDGACHAALMGEPSRCFQASFEANILKIEEFAFEDHGAKTSSGGVKLSLGSDRSLIETSFNGQGHDDFTVVLKRRGSR